MAKKIKCKCGHNFRDHHKNTGCMYGYKESGYAACPCEETSSSLLLQREKEKMLKVISALEEIKNKTKDEHISFVADWALEQIK